MTKKVTRDISILKIVTGYFRVTGYFFRNCHGLRKIFTGYLFENCHGLQKNVTGYFKKKITLGIFYHKFCGKKVTRDTLFIAVSRVNFLGFVTGYF